MFAVTVNNIPVSAVAIHNVTYVEAEQASKAIGVNSIVDNNTAMYATPFEHVKGVLIHGDTYIQWASIAQHVKAQHIPHGWNFEVHDNVIAATPFSETYEYQVLFGLDSQVGVIPFQLDTGAFESYLQPDIAKQLNVILDGKTVQVGGIGGVTTTQEGIIPQLTWGTHMFYNIPCVVNQNWTGPNLFGWRFFQDNGYSLTIDQPNFTLDIIK